MHTRILKYTQSLKCFSIGEGAKSCFILMNDGGGLDLRGADMNVYIEGKGMIYGELQLYR